MRLFTLLIILIISPCLYAAQWYQVELIVFEQLSTYTDEQWPYMPTKTQSAKGLTPSMANAQIQPDSNYKLEGVTNRLNNSSRYRVHYHSAWSQPIKAKRSAKSVNIQSTDGMIQGVVRLYKATYLYATLDLWLLKNKPVTNSWSDISAPGENISGTRNPQLNETRRIRSKKLHFFDHPKLGALLQITPIKTPDSVQTAPLESFSLPDEADPTISESE